MKITSDSTARTTSSGNPDTSIERCAVAGFIPLSYPENPFLGNVTISLGKRAGNGFPQRPHHDYTTDDLSILIGPGVAYFAKASISCRMVSGAYPAKWLFTN